MRTVAPKPGQFMETLFGEYRRRIFALLLSHAGESFHIREIARLTGVPSGSLHRELTLLHGAGLLTRNTLGNQVRYQADTSCPIFEELAAIFRKTTGLADVLREGLAPLLPKIRFAFVFGSLAQGKERTTSDVDVMVVGAVSFASVVELLAATQPVLRREVNPVVMTAEAFKSKLAKGDRFVKRVISGPKIMLLGDPSESGKPS